MFQSILIPLDGSKRAERVLHYLEELARRFESEIFLIQVVEPHIQFIGSQAAHQDEALEEFRQNIKQAETYLNGVKNHLEEKGLHVQIQVALGEAVKPIVNIATGMKVDMIAMSSHGNSGLSRVFYGSVAAGVLYQVDRPLMLIRADDEMDYTDEEVYMYTTILVPLDGSKRAEGILPYVEKLALSFDAKVIFLQVIETRFAYISPYTYYSDAELEQFETKKLIEDAEIYLGGLQGEFQEKGIQARFLVAEGSVVKTIINIAEREGVDLIAMASHGRTGLARVFYGSVAAGVLHQVDRPLLLIRAESSE
jgi:nucleotide-binding universal stress UspA family protein